MGRLATKAMAIRMDTCGICINAPESAVELSLIHI